MYSIDDYDYHLPQELIAQMPAERRDASRLLCLNRQTGSVRHCFFSDLCHRLRPSDLLIINNTEVVPGRLLGHKKETGGRIEALILDYAEALRNQPQEGRLECRCLLKASKQSKPDTTLTFGSGLTARVLAFENGIYRLCFTFAGKFEDHLERLGRMPLPPYIKRESATCDEKSDADMDRADRVSYQTVYASQKGAIAAPTAGLHFSKAILANLKAKGVTLAPVTLHVGYGTFMPVRETDIRKHAMHTEWFSIPSETADAINAARKKGRRIVAVGTTSVRTLEYKADADGFIKPGSGECDLFIYPGYRFKLVDALLTNFHLPKSTLLMLVAAFAGRGSILNAYQQAIRQRYRFFSYGDAMLIE
jgi:S-adenosylmethionine:tRNA ribosyltransferase-isomerase